MGAAFKGCDPFFGVPRAGFLHRVHEPVNAVKSVASIGIGPLVVFLAVGLDKGLVRGCVIAEVVARDGLYAHHVRAHRHGGVIVQESGSENLDLAAQLDLAGLFEQCDGVGACGHDE